MPLSPPHRCAALLSVDSDRGKLLIAAARLLLPRLKIIGKIHGSRPWKVGIRPDEEFVFTCPDCNVGVKTGDLTLMALVVTGLFPFDDIARMLKCQGATSADPSTPSSEK
jgi:hypothetical protein